MFFKAVENEKMRSMRNAKIIMHSEIRIGNITIMFSNSIEEFESRTAGLFIWLICVFSFKTNKNY
ncbi:putative glyoxalase superfamily protein PhnB [Pedobacter sp. UYEF25]